jgi:hypothetical protein
MLAIVCSLSLTGTPLVLTQAQAAGVVRVAHACHCGGTCCVATPSPESQPVPATPVSISSPNQLLTLAPAVWVWTLPGAPATEFSTLSSSSFPANNAPLYARYCAFLI